MVKINYVIATWNGKNNRKHNNPMPHDVLYLHLQKIISLKVTHIAQITIMKANSQNYYENYYNINDIIANSIIPIVVINCENYGFSLGQWLKSYELYNNFDYYIFMEDDYFMNLNNYDTILINLFNQFFEDVGVLCSTVNGSENYKIKGGLPSHFEGMCFINNKTMEKVYNNFLPKTPYQILDTFDKTIDSTIDLTTLRQCYVGGFYQVVFSHLFTLCDIKHKSYLNHHDYKFIYWDDATNTSFKYTTHNIMVDNFTMEDIDNSIILPIQLYNYTEQPHIIFIIGMHRCGTSVLANCLHANGWDIGNSCSKHVDWQNPKGYFENLKLLHLHEEILNYNACTWLDIKILDMKYTMNHINKYKQILMSDFNNSKKILIKDPRLTFFKTFLHEVCESMYNCSFIFNTRNKQECISSLHKAQNEPIVKCEKLYDITHQINKDNMLIIDHNDIIYKNNNVIKNISNYCCILLANTNHIVDTNLHRNKNT